MRLTAHPNLRHAHSQRVMQSIPVNANRELIRRMEAKVKAAIDRVWGA